MFHIVVCGPIHPRGLERLDAAENITYEQIYGADLAAHESSLKNADALLIRTQTLSHEMIGSLERLKIVSRHGVGYDAIDLKALNMRKIPLAIVGDVNSITVAEHTMMLILAGAKRLIAHDHAVRSGQWGYRDQFDAIELHGRRLLVVGYGRIGRRVADLARAFSMEIDVYDPFIDDQIIHQNKARPISDLKDALKQADVVTLHMPANKEGPLIGADELEVMKPHAILVNAARGTLIDEDALADALDNSHIGAAGLDVFAAEPPIAGSKLLANHRIVLTPHNAGLTEECATRMAVKAGENILDFFENRLDPSLVVNAEAIGFDPKTQDAQCR